MHLLFNNYQSEILIIFNYPTGIISKITEKFHDNNLRKSQMKFIPVKVFGLFYSIVNNHWLCSSINIIRVNNWNLFIFTVLIVAWIILDNIFYSLKYINAFPQNSQFIEILRLVVWYLFYKILTFVHWKYYLKFNLAFQKKKKSIKIFYSVLAF